VKWSWTRRRTLALITAVVVVTGLVWMGWECVLSLDGFDALLLGWTAVILLPMAVGPVLGLAIRPRETFRGELLVNVELAGITLLVVFLPAALMFVLFVLGYLASWVVALVCWIVWLVVLVVAFVVQVVIWLSFVLPAVVAVALGIAGGLAVAEESGDLRAGCATGGTGCGCIGVVGYAVLLCGLGAVGDVLGMGAGAMLGGGVLDSALEWTDWILGWNELFEKGHSPMEILDHASTLVFVLSIAAGIAIAFVEAVLVRWVRHLAMGSVMLRPYLPAASAPLPDGAAALHENQLLPAAAWLALVWFGVLAMFVCIGVAM